MNILIAPNAFKNSLDAARVAEAISKGLQQSTLSCTIDCFPVGDGGDGTAALIIQHFNGKRLEATVHDPLGRKIMASFGIIDQDQTAVIELADASGLRLLLPGEYDPLHANTYGTGELIKLALDREVKKIILCIGGSATVDAATGIMQALGVKFFDHNADELQNLPASLINLHRINLSGIDKRLQDTELIVLCDVENTLLGSNGAATTFGPQKGASEKDVQQLENAVARFRDVVFNKTGIDMAAEKYGGAAGGVAAGLYALLDGKLVNGIDYFLDLTGFDAALQKADLVITGEGSIDTQTLQGKAPFGVAKRAKQKSIPVIGLAGKVPLFPDEALQQYFDVLLSINHEALDLTTAMQQTYVNLTRTAQNLGEILNLKK
jgi:glycerate kinase